MQVKLSDNRAAGLGHSRRESAALRLAVHFDALRLDPRAYASAAFWRLCGKRVRARLKLAPLLGRSRRAYRLWLAQSAPLPQESGPLAAITALVQGGEGEERTLASLAREGIATRVLEDSAQLTANDLAGCWILPIEAGDVLARGAGATYRAAAACARENVQLIYADDDLLYGDTERHSPHFKPDWNSELFGHFDFLSGAAILKPSAADWQGLPTQGWAAALAGRVAGRVGKSNEEIVHLRHILHHRRARPAPLRTESLPLSPADLAALPPVSVIIPTRNRLDLLRNCLDGLARTDYPAPLEVLVVDNGSDDPETLDYLAQLDPAFARVLRDDGPFNFAALNNRAVEQASGELLCLLNNDIEVRDPHWLATMAHQAMRPDVGAVGARLLYPDHRIQHAGVVIGIGGGAAHAHRLLHPDEEGYFHRHSLPQFVTAVTAACLVVKRDRFLSVGGFDAAHFAVSFNDVDLCLKLNERGWQSLYEPRATLLHHESVSRGNDRDPAGAARLAGELVSLAQRWIETRRAGQADTDPFHHPALSPFSEQFVLDV